MSWGERASYTHNPLSLATQAPGPRCLSSPRNLASRPPGHAQHAPLPRSEHASNLRHRGDASSMRATITLVDVSWVGRQMDLQNHLIHKYTTLTAPPLDTHLSHANRFNREEL